MESKRLRQGNLEQMKLRNLLDVEQTALETLGTTVDRKRITDQYESVAALAEIAKAQREAIQEKYSRLEPREANVFTIRGIPHWRPDARTSAPVGFVMHVPESREIWLKFAAVQEENGNIRRSELDQLKVAPSNTGFTPSGLYQQKIPPGKRILRYLQIPNENEAFCFQLWLDQTLLLQSQFMEERSKSTGWSSLGGRDQSDFPPARRLPWLFSARVEWEPVVGEGFLESGFRPTFWLSDKKGDAFDGFPGKVTQDE